MRLVLKPIFRWGEAPSSLAARASLQRNLSPSRFLTMVGAKSLATLDGLGNLERCLGCQAGSVSEWAFLSAGKAMMSLRGLKFHATSGIAQLPRVCTSCLTEDRANNDLERDPNLRPYIRSIWSLAHLTICPAHRIPLIDRCKCGASIDISRAPQDRCRNGHRLAAPPPRIIAEPEMRANEIVSAKIFGISTHCHPQLEPLNWLEAGSLLCALGTFHDQGRRATTGLHGSLHADDMRARMGYGMVVVDGMPGSFERLLEHFASPEVRALDPSTTVDSRPGVYGVQVMQWLRTSKIPGMETFRSIVDACEERRFASDSSRQAVPNIANKRARTFADVPDNSFHTRIKRVPDETPRERVERAKAVWQRKLTPNEVERLSAQGLDVSLRTRRIDALKKCRQNDLVVTRFGAGTILGVDPKSVHTILEAGALDLAWSTDGTQELCFRAEVNDLKRRLFDKAAEPSPGVDYLRFGYLRGRTRIGAAISAALSGMPIARTAGSERVDHLLVARDIADAALWKPRNLLRTEGYSAAEFGERYALDKSLVARLFKDGVVEAIWSGLFLRVSPQEAATFDTRYVSAARASREYGIHTRTLNLRLRAFGVTPIYTGHHSCLYRRADIAKLFKFTVSLDSAAESCGLQSTSGATVAKRRASVRERKAPKMRSSTSHMRFHHGA